jgi:hypothetical protein
VLEDLGERVPVDVEVAAGGALAQAVDEDATADLGPVLQVGEHPGASQRGPTAADKGPAIVDSRRGLDKVATFSDRRSVTPGPRHGISPTITPNEHAWDRSIAAFRADLKAMMDLVAGLETDLFAPISHGQGRTILREARSVADHGAHHPGQLATLRRLLGAWHDE